MRHFLKASAAAGILLTIAACGSLGLTEPRSFSDRLAYGYSTTTALRAAATSSLNAGAITSTEGRYVQNLADESRTVLDAARTAYTAGDVSTAEGRLTLALSVLDQLQSYLTNRSAAAGGSPKEPTGRLQTTRRPGQTLYVGGASNLPARSA